jgi:hypothetical protein
MAEPKLTRRGHGEDAIYFAASKNRYVGAVSLGFTPDGKRIRRKVSGKTKQEVRDKFRALHKELDAGIRSPSGYTVRRWIFGVAALAGYSRPWQDGASSAHGGMSRRRSRPLRSLVSVLGPFALIRSPLHDYATQSLTCRLRFP